MSRQFEKSFVMCLTAKTKASSRFTIVRGWNSHEKLWSFAITVRISMSKNQFCFRNWFARHNLHVSGNHWSRILFLTLAAIVRELFVSSALRRKQRSFMKCHPYLWLAPLPLGPCLNPQSACYIYIVMPALLLTKHFLFDCTHKKARAYKLLSQILRENSSNFFLLSLYSTFILFDIKSQRIFSSLVFSFFCKFFPRTDFFL